MRITLRVFLDDKLADLPALARILFNGVLSIADCDGRVEDRPKRIKAILLPYENCDIENLLDTLSHAGFLQRVEEDNMSYYEIVNVRRWF